MEGARDEVVVGKVGLVVVHVDLAEVAVLEVRQRLEPRRQEDGAHEGGADGRQQHRDPEGLKGERETSEAVLEVAMTSEINELPIQCRSFLEAPFLFTSVLHLSPSRGQRVRLKNSEKRGKNKLDLAGFNDGKHLSERSR